jgi:hypothetical protein
VPETREASVAEAAEQAAALRDYATAERLLRELLLLQKMRLGPLHADLANTFNNLGVVCDITDKPADAEFFYRRAMTIARVSLAPDHEFVATSEKNLRDFCAVRGLPFESAVRLNLQANGVLEPSAESRRLVPEPAAVEAASVTDASTTTPSSRFTPWVVVGLAATVAVIALWAWSSSRARSSPAPDVRLQDSPAPPATETKTPPPPDPGRTPESAEKPVEPKGAAPVAGESPPADTREAPARDAKAERKDAPGGPAPTVASARLCKSLSTDSSRPFDDWPCENPGSPAGEGTLFFFTRVRSVRDTTVEHRWYRGSELVKVVPLEVRASPTDGYRTYSRNVVDARGGSDWHVELLTKDGVVLHEERFSVH